MKHGKFKHFSKIMFTSSINTSEERDMCLKKEIIKVLLGSVAKEQDKIIYISIIFAYPNNL